MISDILKPIKTDGKIEECVLATRVPENGENMSHCKLEKLTTTNPKKFDKQLLQIL